MELKRKTITLVEFSTSQAALDALHTDDRYMEPFIVEDKWGGIHTVTLCWFQGYGENYQFIREGEDRDTGISPVDVAYIEEKALVS